VVKISRHGSQEAAALGKVSHPSVAPIYSVKHDAAGEWTLICMPLLGVATGIDLLDAAFAAGAERNGALVERVAVKTRPLAAIQETGGRHPEGTRGTEFTWELTYGEAIARVGLQLAEGLMAAHAAGIMHRDIKPSNVLLAWSGRSMLLDFNLATDASAADAGFGGTLAYMAPENMACVLEGRGEAADPRCDVYSLGAVLYELLTGKLPAEPANAEKLSPVAYQPWLDCKRAKIQAPAEAGIDPRLMAIVLKCLEFDPKARIASAAELAAELRVFLQLAARPRAMRKQVRRSILAAAVAVALLVVGGGVWAYVGTRPMTVDQLYQRGLAEYEGGKYEQAVSTFSQCLERRSGWTDAQFGRGQALLKMESWPRARTDFDVVRDVEPTWGNALVGYCDMRMRDNNAASTEFTAAYDRGLRNQTFLMNYARVEANRQQQIDAIRLYDEVINSDPNNALAYRNRGLIYVALVWNDKKEPVDPQALEDADESYRLEPNSFEAACGAAIIYGEAARKDAKFQDKAAYYLTLALRKGMPIEATNPYSIQLRRIFELVDKNTLAGARHDDKYRIHFTPAHEPPNLADWNEFQKQFGVKQKLVARSK
jgi:tetratricopeptide (TPR) repeat protein